MKKERTLKQKLSATAWTGGTVGVILVLLLFAAICFKDAFPLQTRIVENVAFLVFWLNWIVVRQIKGKQIRKVLNIPDSKRIKQEFFNVPSLAASPEYQFLVYALDGDYRQIVTLATCILQGKTAKKDRCLAYSYLISAYLILGEKEKLQAAYDDSQKEKISLIGVSVADRNMENESWCALFLSTEDVLDIVKEKVSEPEESGLPYYEIYTRFLKGCMAYRFHLTEKAKELLQSVMADAPNLGISECAARYLAAMDSGKLPDFPDITENTDAEKVQETEKKLESRQRNHMFMRVLILVLLAVTFIVSIANTNYMIQYGKYTKNREEQEMLYGEVGSFKTEIDGRFLGVQVSSSADGLSVQVSRRQANGKMDTRYLTGEHTVNENYSIEVLPWVKETKYVTLRMQTEKEPVKDGLLLSVEGQYMGEPIYLCLYE